MNLTIREINLADMNDYIALKHHVKSHSSYLLFEEDENILTNDAEQKLLETVITSTNSTIFLAFDGAQLIGYMDVIGYISRRQRHIATVFPGLHADYRHQGIGSELMKTTTAWAVNHNVRRLQSSVVKENEAALALFNKFDFSIEGTRRKAVLINNEFLDEYYLAKLL